MQKSIEIKPKFLLVIAESSTYRGKEVMEFEDEKELRATALSQAEKGFEVKAYRVSGVAKATSYAALNMRWQ